MTVEYTATNISTKTLEFNNGQIEGVPANPRTITQKDYENLKNSIKQSGIYGFKAPIVYKTDNRYIVLGGNMRLKACKELNILEIPIFLLADDTPTDELMKIAIQDNISNGEWDWDLLANEWPQDKLEEWGLDTTQEWDTKKELPENIDETPEPPKTPISKLGDLWLLGNHRVLCGDSTDKATVERLMDGKKADMIFTDPPYGMELDTDYSQMNGTLRDGSYIKRNKHEAVIGDDGDYDPTHIFEQFGYVKEIFLWGFDYYAEHIPERKNGSVIVWDKTGDETKDKGFGSSFELCWSRQKHKRTFARIWWQGIFGVKDDQKGRVHPTQKPVQLATWFFERWAKDLTLVIDLFLGSGSTLIACEQTDRTCYGLELDPHYVDVICKRWQTLTGQLPILESTGEAHDFCS